MKDKKKKPIKPTKPAGTTRAKKTTSKSKTPKQTKPQTAKSNTSKTKPSNKAKEPIIKHSDKEEMSTSAVKPIVIKNNKGNAVKSVPKVLRRVNKTKGGYTAWDARTGKTFATEKEAKDYALDVLKKTGLLIPVTPTDRQVTHTFKPEEEKKKK